MSAANPVTLPLAVYKARHIRLAVDGKVATITLDRPDKKNPLTFDSYAELADLFRAGAKEKAVSPVATRSVARVIMNSFLRPNRSVSQPKNRAPRHAPGRTPRASSASRRTSASTTSTGCSTGSG